MKSNSLNIIDHIHSSFNTAKIALIKKLATAGDIEGAYASIERLSIGNYNHHQAEYLEICEALHYQVSEIATLLNEDHDSVNPYQRKLAEENLGRYTPKKKKTTSSLRRKSSVKR